MLDSTFVIAHYTLREALKNKILTISIVMAIIGIGGATFIGDYALVETTQTEVTFLAPFYRYCAVFAMILLVVSTMVREFSDKCLELYLSLPLSRAAYFFGKLFGFFLACVAVAAIYALVLLLFDVPGVLALAWGLSLTAELFIVTALAFFCVMTFNQQAPASVMAATLFYLLCRASDDLVLISQSDILLHTVGITYLSAVMDGLVFVLPSLGRFTELNWLLYDSFKPGEVIPLLVGETVIYVVLLSGAALIDFTRKNI